MLLRIIFSILVLCFFTGSAYAQVQDDIDSTHAKTVASYTNYKDCIKLYKLPFDKTYLLALSAVGANNYEIVEMQSRNGYVIFKAGNREFLLSVLKKDKNYTFLKLSPCDNNYYFSPQIPFKIFNYVALHFNNEVKEIKL